MKDKILNILKANRSEWTSGADICRRLAVSRTAIWKNIKNLKQAGYNIETQHRLGYRLVEIPDFLYPAEITAGLATKCLGQQVIHYHQENSTNEAAKKLARQGAEQGTVVVAEQQSSGKGRMGRHWHSAAGADVLFSIILYPEISLAEIPQISMLAVVAIAKAVEKVCAVQAGIKWPNDLLVNGQKLCGVLVEMAAEADRVRYVVLGIGINVNSLPLQWPEEIRSKTTSLRAECGQEVSRVKLIQAVLEALELLYDQWHQQGFAPISKLWRTWCVSQHCPATVKTIQGNYTGWIEGVSDSGALLLRMDDGRVKTFLSGDVSLAVDG
ncbi:MAG: biotin--[acetyl-CoA-carboxylase] ligase [Desulfotomaculum sp.]|nr:biotin--[acetyl-CoA-carboxylase] ligase [Desulfotomaculum sp.]